MFQKLDLLFIFCAFDFLCLVRMEECTTQNITCKDIKSPDGYKYKYLQQPKNLGPVLEIHISQNRTPICSGKVGHLNLSSEVVHCDGNSITKKTCNNLKGEFIHDEKGGIISESCQVFNITDIQSSTGCNWSCFVIVFVCVLATLIVCGYLGWFLWRKLRKGKREGRCLSDLGNKKGKSGAQEEQSVEENDRNCRHELALARVKAMSKSVTADVPIDMDAVNTITNDDVPRVNGVAAQNGLNGNMRHDPGGGKDKEQHGNGNLQNCGQRTHKKKSFNCHKDNGCLSSRNQESAREEAFDETAGDEGQALVDSSGPGRESLTPPHDVETGIHSEEKTLLNHI